MPRKQKCTQMTPVSYTHLIWGIQLKSKKLPELALPQNAVVHKADPNAELPEPVIQYGKAMLKGKLLDSAIVYISQILTRQYRLECEPLSGLQSRFQYLKLVFGISSHKLQRFVQT